MRPSAEHPRIALFAEAREWHTRALGRALEARGASVVVVSLRDCAIDTSGAEPLRLPGFEALPAAAFVRTVPGGSFEEVTLRLGVLHALKAAGVPVWNGPRAIERCVDKSMTSLLLARAGLPTPPTWVSQGRESAAAIVRREAGPLVSKPLFGAQGRGLRFVRAVEDLPPEDEVSGVYYLQAYAGADRDWRDHRILVAGGRVLAAMVRHGTGWITNLHQGARAEAYEPGPEPAALALAAASLVGADYAGVDLIQAADGRWLVLEVNSMPAWAGLQGVASFDIAASLAGAFLARVRGPAPAGCAS